MTDLIDTTEMYLKAIYELEEEHIPPMRARIAERLDHSGPTVSQTVARMERDGLLRLLDDRQLQFTDVGRLTAVEVMRKHRLAEQLLLEVIGLEWSDIHDEACRWEHVMSESVERKLIGLLKNPSVSPFGMPVPGLELLGLPPADIRECFALSSLEPGEYEIVRIGEPLQLDGSFLNQLAELSLLPGAKVTLSTQEQGWLLVSTGLSEGLLVDTGIAQHLFLGVSKVL
ncbi:metal-dependent transcriptional regulator [Candidatus Aquiluna sp. IMCC13023]|mgnify:FL=1|jgi:DtxR family Mn-dependent transcriptional regulator|uniref:metal-dependent transcriptional regulator n=1 Tax=Candidatus Aquiluna sp. IMCC13023 TaxID=1081644 RepID=UPI00025B11DE|nr:metal-dependent transcriptional regulator [Candidatus Aquiluna sp. IMCC13023]EIC92422.1 metal-dependent transcriptional regulator [Candidatus Aquiluna sp. IMCC13023]